MFEISRDKFVSKLVTVNGDNAFNQTRFTCRPVQNMLLYRPVFILYFKLDLHIPPKHGMGASDIHDCFTYAYFWLSLTLFGRHRSIGTLLDSTSKALLKGS